MPSYEGDLNPYQRLKMCNYVCEALGPNFNTFDYQINKKYIGSTYGLIKILKEDYPNINFYLVASDDKIEKILKNYSFGQELFTENPFIIIKRSGCQLKNNSHILTRTIEIKFPCCSSKEIRKQIKFGNYEKAKSQLPWQVWQEIETEKLYEYENNYWE